MRETEDTLNSLKSCSPVFIPEGGVPPTFPVLTTPTFKYPKSAIKLISSIISYPKDNEIPETKWYSVLSGKLPVPLTSLPCFPLIAMLSKPISNFGSKKRFPKILVGYFFCFQIPQ